MAKYNVGDKVKVHSDLSSVHGASKVMADLWAGKVVTISEVDPINPLFGKMEGDYHIEEDTVFPTVKFIWSDLMFEGLAEEETKSDNPMPKLVNGMFGREDDGDLFVVVNDVCVFKSGDWDYANAPEWNDRITHLYNARSFKAIEMKRAEVIWERTPDKVEESKEAEESKVDVNALEMGYYNLLRTVFGVDLDNKEGENKCK